MIGFSQIHLFSNTGGLLLLLKSTMKSDLQLPLVISKKIKLKIHFQRSEVLKKFFYFQTTREQTLIIVIIQKMKTFKFQF